MGIARMIERSGELANLPFPIHAHMRRHSRRLQHFLGHANIPNTE